MRRVPDAEKVEAALRRYRAGSLRLLLPGIAGLALAVTGTAATRGDDRVGWVVLGFLALFLAIPGLVVLRRYRKVRRIVAAHPWRATEFAYAQTLYFRGSSTGVIFLRDPGDGHEAVLFMASGNRQDALIDIGEATIPFAGDIATGGAVYVPSSGDLLRARPFRSIRWQRFVVRSVVSGGRLYLGEREYQASRRRPLDQQHDFWSGPAKRGFDTDKLRGARPDR